MFTSDIRHKEGKSLVVPDWLSRPAGCPIGRAYRIESENDFENDNVEFKMPVKGQIVAGTLKSTLASTTPSGGNSHTTAPSNVQSTYPNTSIATPGGENSQAAAPPSENRSVIGKIETTETPSGQIPNYVAPELTLAALEQVALQILSPETIAESQKSCPDVAAHKAGQMP